MKFNIFITTTSLLEFDVNIIKLYRINKKKLRKIKMTVETFKCHTKLT